MKKHVIYLEPENFYHIFNRGINGNMIFFNPNNYQYLLNLLREKIGHIAHIYCYCFMQNHFHLLVKIKSEKEIRNYFDEKESIDISKIISKQFSNVFNSYTQAINKSISRTGKLFELPFRRIWIEDNEQLLKTIFYIHCNPLKHGIERDFGNHQYSSYNLIKLNFEQKPEFKEIFENLENFEAKHKEYALRYL